MRLKKKEKKVCFGKIYKFPVFSLTGHFFLAIFPVFPVHAVGTLNSLGSGWLMLLSGIVVVDLGQGEGNLP